MKNIDIIRVIDDLIDLLTENKFKRRFPGHWTVPNRKSIDGKLCNIFLTATLNENTATDLGLAILKLNDAMELGTAVWKNILWEMLTLQY